MGAHLETPREKKTKGRLQISGRKESKWPNSNSIKSCGKKKKKKNPPAGPHQPLPPGWGGVLWPNSTTFFPPFKHTVVASSGAMSKSKGCSFFLPFWRKYQQITIQSLRNAPLSLCLYPNSCSLLVWQEKERILGEFGPKFSTNMISFEGKSFDLILLFSFLYFFLLNLKEFREDPWVGVWVRDEADWLSPWISREL